MALLMLMASSLPLPTVAIAGDVAEVEAEKAEVESLIIDLRRQQLELGSQIKALQTQYAERQLELDQHQAELTRLQAEARALSLESRGEVAEADFVRRNAGLDQETRALTSQFREISLRRQEDLDPLKRQRETLNLRLREIRNAENSDDEQEVSRQLRRADDQIGMLDLEIKLEELVVKVEHARLYQEQAELRYEKALFFARDDEAARTEQRIQETIERRRSFEVDSIFVELEQELRVERSQTHRALEAPDLSAEQRAELRLRLRALGEDFNRLGRARRTHRHENELGIFQQRLSRHFEDLERAEQSASSTEAEAVAEERERLRAAVRALIAASP